MDDTRSDEILMAAYIAGERRAFELLFARYSPRLHGFFLRAVRDSSMADELLQMTFLKLHQVRASYQSERPLRPWLFTIAASVRNDELRRRYRRAEVLDEAKLAQADESRAVERSRDDDHDNTVLAERVRAAVERLPESQRVVVYLHRYEGLTFGEIATVLGAKEGALRVRAFRAYDTLRKDLQEFLAAEETQ